MPTTPPSKLKVTSQSSASVGLSWTAPIGGADSYNLYRSKAELGGFGPYVLVNGAPIVGTTYSDITPSSSGNTYEYRVTAVVTGVESVFSNGVSGLFKTATSRFSPSFEADLAATFAPPFGQDAIYTEFGQPPKTIKVVPNGDDEDFSAQGGTAMTNKLNAWTRTSDTPNASNKDTLELAGVVYSVIEPTPNFTTGITVLGLSLKGVR